MALLVDAHAHLHDGVSIAAFLGAARANVRRATRGLPAADLQAVLCLADYAGAEGFVRLRSATADGWTRDAADAAVLRWRADDGAVLWVVAGRQVVTAERLEVMAIGIASSLADGQPLASTLDQVRAAGGLPVLPWGVGKWFGRRGALVEDASRRHGAALPLGDNGGRPNCWRPRPLAQARARGVAVLPGTDPLRLPEDRLRSGSFGLALAGEAPAPLTAGWLQHRLTSPEPGDRGFGRPLGLLAFASRQWRLRTRDRG